MTKLHSAISQVFNTQHGLRPLVQRLLRAPARLARRAKGIKSGEPDYDKQIRNRQSMSQLVFLKLNLRINQDNFLSLQPSGISQVNTAWQCSACSHRSSFCVSYNVLTVAS